MKRLPGQLPHEDVRLLDGLFRMDLERALAQAQPICLLTAPAVTAL